MGDNSRDWGLGGVERAHEEVGEESKLQERRPRAGKEGGLGVGVF